MQQRCHGRGLDGKQRSPHAQGQQHHHPALHPALSRQRHDLVLQRHLLADGVGQPLQRLGQVAAAFIGNAHGGPEKSQVITAHPAFQIQQRIIQRHPQPQLPQHQLEFLTAGCRQLAGHLP